MENWKKGQEVHTRLLYQAIQRLVKVFSYYFIKKSWAYCKIKVNPNTLLNKLVFDDFLCHIQLNYGFKDAYRPFIGLIGCFMKTEIGVVLLSATSMDANNQMYPMAIVAVTKETNNY